MTATEPTLPGMPAPPEPKRTPPKPGVRATRIKPHRLCARCCELIHVLGQASAPYPRSARWRVHYPDKNFTDMCDAHKDEALE